MPAPDLTRAIMAATLAPSIHNTQPWRFRRDGADLVIGADLARHLPVSDPDLAGMGLSCGAVAEAMVLALSQQAIGAAVTDLWANGDLTSWPGFRLAARIHLGGVAERDPLARSLDQRFTWRGAFASASHMHWTRPDATLIEDGAGIAWIAALNDRASLIQLRKPGIRRELLRWMRLSAGHPRAGQDGMDLSALRMQAGAARWVRLAFGPLWRGLDILGRTKAIATEAPLTETASVIALFHRPAGESPVTSGRAYLRLWLDATSRGLAGWPMAALTDQPLAQRDILARFGIGEDRHLVQVIRFGAAPGPMPPRARRSLSEVWEDLETTLT